MDSNNNIKLSNVIGAPFSDYVLLQLYRRAAHNSTINRTNEEVLFLANKTSWARLVSSVNIELQPASNAKVENNDYETYYGRFGLGSALPYNKPDSLAKNWILEAGCSIQNGNGINLRAGIGPDGAYGLGGTEELGYRPMPGLTGVTIETTGRLGSLRQANIQFKVWNMNQLNVIEALYFRLGYSMLLEWGHTQYFGNDNVFQSKEIYGIDDPFIPGRRKEQIQQDIARKSKQTYGNYDGMLGIVSNFNWAMNQDGGFDCTVKLVGLGSVMDSMRINQAYKLPDGLIQQYKKNKDDLAQAQKRLDELAAQVKYLKDNPPTVSANNNQNIPTDRIDTTQQLLAFAKKYDEVTNEDEFFLDTQVYKASFGANSLNNVFKYPADYFYIPTGKPGDTPDYITKLKNKYAGLYKTGYTSTGIGQNIIEFIPLNTTELNINVVALQKRIQEYLTAFPIPGFPDPTGIDHSEPIQRMLNRAIETQDTNVDGDIVTKPSTLSDNTIITSVPNTATVYFVDPSEDPAKTTLIVSSRLQEKRFYFKINVAIKSPNPKQFSLSKGEILNAIGIWVTGNATPNGVVPIDAPKTKTFSQVSLKEEGSGDTKSVVVTGKSSVTFKKHKYTGTESNTNQIASTQDVTVEFTFVTNDTGLINGTGVAPQQGVVVPQPAQTPNAGDTNGTTNTDSATQTQAAEGFASALEAMLTVVQAATQFELSKSSVKGIAVNITDLTSKFFQDGIMNGVLSDLTKDSIDAVLRGKFDLIAYAKKGFNSTLMTDPTSYAKIPDVKFPELCKAFAFAYGQGGEDGSTSILTSPTYISFGYLLAFLNNMCLIYDSPDKALSTNNNPTTGVPKRPYVYIDFNPGTNFCLTSPQQLSVDPYTCLVPLQATKAQYETIFPENIYKHWRSQATPIFNPTGSLNGVSTVIAKAGSPYKTPANAYQGRIMDILLNIDYLLNQVKSFASGDTEHAVKLEPFLQQILQDVNKALGNTNLFRVAYRDDSNTIQIQDDQWVPSLNGAEGSETSMLNAESYNSKLKAGNDREIAGLLPIISGPKELPIAGTLSLARQFQLRSVMSTKLASMVAISAQANTGSVNATDHSSLSYLNENFQDRYKPYIQDASNGESGTNANSKNPSGDSESNDRKAAELFNDHIINVYSNFKVSADRIGLAKNYYIERMSKVKSGDPVVTAAPFIPAELEMTIDGISGIIMGNAFTIPQDRLPLSLRGKGGLAKIAFIVTGLTHTIQNNEWLTRIKGQMIKLREEVKQVTAASLVGEIQKQEGNVSSPSTNPRGTDLFRATNAPKTSKYLFGSAKSGLDTAAPAHPNWGDLQSVWQNNNAWDLGVAAGTPVYAIADGTVSNVGFYENGNTVWGYKFTLVSSNNSFFLTHLDSVVVSAGTSVKKGDLVGYIGQWPSTYPSRLQSYPHLHIGLKTGKLSTYIDNTGKLL
jgi:hypothetical protein